MPISPSDLPWWGWLLCAIIGGGISYLIGVVADADNKGGCFALVIAFVGGIASLLCGIIGVVRLVKWAWGG